MNKPGLGLTWNDLQVHEATLPERNALGITLKDGQCFVIPYRDVRGNMTDYYVGLVPKADGMFKTVRVNGLPERIYFPYGFFNAYMSHVGSTRNVVVICNDEIVSTYLVKNGIASCSFEGLYGWRRSGFLVPAESEVEEITDPNVGNGQTYLKVIPPPGLDAEQILVSLAPGVRELLDLGLDMDMGMGMDMDMDEGTKYVLTHTALTKTLTAKTHVAQRSIASFKWELYLEGIPTSRIRQYTAEESLYRDLYDIDRFKASIDEENWEALDKCAYPDVKAFLARNMHSHRMKRKQGLKYAGYIMADLESKGQRFLTANSDIFYFHQKSRLLMQLAWGKGRDQSGLHETEFGRFLYREYGVNSNDQQLLSNIAAYFTEDADLPVIKPQRVLAHTEKDDIAGTTIHYQLSDSSFIAIQSNSTKILDNGSRNVMFLANQVEPIDSRELEEHLFREKNTKPECWWIDVFEGLNVVQTSEEIPVWQTQRLHSLLPYISPWMLHWNNTQLPIEIITGEGGSGKSSLLTMRQMILTGRPLLRNSPNDVRDWHAGISASGGIYTVDNVHFTSKLLRQKLSDEMCRITTERNPHIEMRKLYTTADVYRAPIRCTFAITALMPPFNNQDILQRSFPLHLNAIRHKRVDGEYVAAHDALWVESSLDLRGGRIAWVAHHIAMLQRILKAIEVYWDYGYMSHGRLANLEQLLRIVHNILFPREDTSWIPKILTKQIKAEGNETQEILDGLSDFFAEWSEAPTTVSGRKGFGTKEISEWARQEREYKDNVTLTNSRALGKFLVSYERTVQDEVGIVQIGRSNNRSIFGLDE